MNSLSWLLYWADVLPSLSSWLAFLSFLLFVIFALAIGLGYGMMSDAGEIQKKWDDERHEMVKCLVGETPLYKTGRSIRLFGFMFCPLFFVLWGASFLVPEKETFYLIAGSEAGERALQTPEFGKVRAVINKYLDDQLPDVEDKKEEK